MENLTSSHPSPETAKENTMATNPLHDVLTNRVGTNTVLQGRALTTQESHRHTGAFKPYIYRGTGQDIITGTKPRTRKEKNTAPTTT